MKKTLGILLVSLASVAMADLKTIEANYQKINSGYQELLKMEQNEFNRIQSSAMQAEKTVDSLTKQKAQVEEKLATIETLKNTSFYKKEYANIAKGYKDVLKMFDAQIKEENKKISQYEQIKRIKGVE